MVPQRSPFVLVIEPSLVLRRVILTSLSRNGFSTTMAYAHPLEALKAIVQRQIPVPDIALVCRNMPWPDGYEVIAYLRKNGYPTKCILLLSHDGSLERIKARLAGARASLAKPLTVQALLHAVATVS